VLSLLIPKTESCKSETDPSPFHLTLTNILLVVAEGVIVAFNPLILAVVVADIDCDLRVISCVCITCKTFPTPVTPLAIAPVKFAAGKLVRLAPDPLNGLSTVIFPVPSGVDIFVALIVDAIIYP